MSSLDVDLNRHRCIFSGCRCLRTYQFGNFRFGIEFAHKFAQVSFRRRRIEGPEQRLELALELSRSAAYEVAFEHLYPLLPPCRECGCVLFQPLRVEQLRQFRTS